MVNTESHNLRVDKNIETEVKIAPSFSSTADDQSSGTATTAKKSHRYHKQREREETNPSRYEE